VQRSAPPRRIARFYGAILIHLLLGTIANPATSLHAS